MEPTATVDELYEQHIRMLTPQQKRQLMEKLAQELEPPVEEETRSSRLLELAGLGAELWQGTDAQRYVNQQRDEWERGQL